MSQDLFKIAVEAPLHFPLTYSGKGLQRGQSVIVPLGTRKVKGVVLGEGAHDPDAEFEIKEVSEVSDRPSLPEISLKWLNWLSDYYLFPLGQVTASAFPPLKKKSDVKRRKKSPVVPELPLSHAPTLTEEQRQVVEAISSQKGFKSNLLFGVTGSGKTEVYLQLLDMVVRGGQQGIVLVPEISLTPQLIERFSARFPGLVAVIHSHLSPREKTDQWWRMVDGDAKILVGARSALFCPLNDIGMIIVDEEHEPSFKQDEKLKYHARDSAIMLAHLHDCPIVLGSATPSLESWNNVLKGRYQLFEMKNRVANRSLPTVQVIDLKHEKEKRKSQDGATELPFWLSKELYELLALNFNNGKQSALFLNRRGSAHLALCESCGYTYECPNCSISLTLHGKTHLVCHYCDYSEQLKELCPDCKQGEIQTIGLGTEKIERDLHNLFPEARLIRADRDEITRREDLEDFVKRVERHEVDIIVGTQMIAKGLDFPNLTLVGLVLADIGFNLPDFRASERSFQLLTQMGGRAGRHSEDPGSVVIQTFSPGHPSIHFTLSHDFKSFAEMEMSTRKSLSYPPFGKLAMIRLSANQLSKVSKTADILQHRAYTLSQKFEAYGGIQALGPSPAPLAKLNNKHRYHMLIKAGEHQVLRKFILQVLGNRKWIPSGTKVQVDIDPLNML